MENRIPQLTALAERLCKEIGLARVYFTRRFGKRSHFLAGFGDTVFDRADRMPLSENLEMHWHGPLDEAGRRRVREIVVPIVQTIEKEIRE